MKASLLNKLDNLSDRFEELTALLGDAEVISKQTQFRAYSKEYAEIEPVIATFRELRKPGEFFIDALRRIGHDPFKAAANGARHPKAEEAIAE